MSIIGKFVFFGWRNSPQKPAERAPISISFDMEDDCAFAAKHWAKVSGGYAACYCVQDDNIAKARPYAKFWSEPVEYRR